MIKLRWVIPRRTRTSKHDYCGEKWSNTWEEYGKRILQYSLDGENWYDVESLYVDIPESDWHLYEWDSKIRNNKVSTLKKF